MRRVIIGLSNLNFNKEKMEGVEEEEGGVRRRGKDANHIIGREGRAKLREA